ncbi:MAG: hypothetical protein IKA02_05890, partial [Clostridia bacterium]|nr:hypothetical protein [Clostridia bacterium]
MKKKIILVLFALLTILFVLTLSINAQEICTHENKTVTSVKYDDYTQKGTMEFTCPDCSLTSMELAPLITLKGFSLSENDEKLCIGYTINNEAVQSLKSINDKFQIGMVAGAKKYLGDKAPLDSKTSNPVDLSAYNASVLKAEVTNGEYSAVDLKLEGFDLASSFEELYLSAYVYDGSAVKYVMTSTKDTPKNVSLVSVKYSEAVTIDGVSFSLFQPDSTIAWDRQRQMNNSKADFNTGSNQTQSELDSTISDTKLITNGFTTLLYPNGSSYMKHYLTASGADYTINMSSSGFFKSSDTKAHRTTRITQAMRAAEALAVEGGKVNVYQKTEQVNHFSSSTDDWRLSVGSYFTCINMLDVTVTVGADGTKTYSAKVEYNVADFYNWETNDYNRQLKDILPSPHDLHELHKAGLAQEFVSKG